MAESESNTCVTDYTYSSPPDKGQRVKLGVQFVKHYISRTCLLPKECPGPQDGGGESSSHSGRICFAQIPDGKC